MSINQLLVIFTIYYWSADRLRACFRVDSKFCPALLYGNSLRAIVKFITITRVYDIDVVYVETSRGIIGWPCFKLPALVTKERVLYHRILFSNKECNAPVSMVNVAQIEIGVKSQQH